MHNGAAFRGKEYILESTMDGSQEGFLPYDKIKIDDPILEPCLREIHETEESKAKCKEILRKELRNLQDIEPCLEESFLLQFLRVSKFDTSNAAQRIQKHYQHQENLLNACRNIRLPLRKAQSLTYVLTSPYRMKNNSSLLIILGGKVDYSKFTFGERLCLDLLALNAVCDNPMNQIAGITLLLDFKGFNLRFILAHTPNWVMLLMEAVNVIPARIKSIHIVNYPAPFLAIYRMSYPFLSKKIQGRLFLHPNNCWKSLHEAIPPEVLPESYGGKVKLDSLINVHKNIEELNDRFRKKFKYGFIKTKKDRQSFSPISR